MPLTNSLHRKNIGLHTYFHDKKQKSQKQQDNYILRLSRRPGLHFDNIRRQNVAYSILQLMSILSSAQINNSSFTRKQKNDDKQFSYYQNNQKNFRSINKYKGNKIQRMSIEIEDNSLNVLRQPRHAATNIHIELIKKNRSKIHSSSSRKKRSIPIPPSKKISNRNAEIHTEQFRKIFELLKKNGCEPDLTKPINLLNKLIHYINVESKTRIKEIEMLLASAFESSNKEEFILDGHEVTFMTRYLNYEILGMSLNDFFLDQIRFIKLYPQLLLNNDYLKIRFNSFLDFPSDKGELSNEANRYYRESVLNKLLPTLALQLNAEDRIELKGIDITQPRWGFIHAGARILNDSGANLGDMRLTDIEDVGIILNLMLCEKSLPQTYAGYFRLPALIYYAKTKPNALSIPMINEYDMQKIFQHYFDYVEKWQKINSPIEQLNDLLNDWKTRPDLAKNKLRHYKISYDWLTNYLNSHGEMKLASKSEKRIFETNGFVHRIPNKIIQLPNIDKIFEDQNLKLADALLKVDELLLPQIFNSLSEDAQRFIEQSRVDRVRIQFNARDSISGVALAPSSQMGLVQSDAFVYHIPDHIDLLQCTLKGAKISYEHIYALTKSNATGSYMIKRVDRDRKALLDLLDDSGIPRYDEDYKIRVTSHLRLKEKNDPPGKLIENLAEVHKKKLLIKLYNQGYDKTTQEKVKDFLLNLIPFYTCITEGVKGNEQEATLACIIDFANLIPFAGKAVYTGIRFSSILGKTAVRAVRYGARKTTVKMALKEIVVNMIQHSPLIAHEISPEVMRRLGTQFLNDINPSFGLLKYGGNKGVNAIENILSKIKNKSYGITKLSDALKKINHDLSTPFKSRTPKFDEAKQKDNVQSINEFSSTIQLRVSNECKRLITEWSQLKSNLDEDLDKLYFLAENMEEAEPALADFIEAGNVGINEYQRYGTDTSSGKYEREAKELYHTYDRLKNYDGFSYRVIILPSERVSSFKVGDVILDKGFASSSALINNAKEWLHSGYIKQNIKMDHKFVLVIYDKNVDKKIAGNSFLIDHIMVRPGEKTLINNIDTLTEKGVGITVLGLSKYFGVADAADIYTNKT